MNNLTIVDAITIFHGNRTIAKRYANQQDRQDLQSITSFISKRLLAFLQEADARIIHDRCARIVVSGEMKSTEPDVTHGEAVPARQDPGERERRDMFLTPLESSLSGEFVSHVLLTCPPILNSVRECDGKMQKQLPRRGTIISATGGSLRNLFDRKRQFYSLILPRANPFRIWKT